MRTERFKHPINTEPRPDYDRSQVKSPGEVKPGQTYIFHTLNRETGRWSVHFWVIKTSPHERKGMDGTWVFAESAVIAESTREISLADYCVLPYEDGTWNLNWIEDPTRWPVNQ